MCRCYDGLAEGQKITSLEGEKKDKCTPVCQNQMCGTEDAVAYYDVKAFDVVYGDCESALLWSKMSRGEKKVKLSLPQNMEGPTEVMCEYEDKEICQSPLISGRGEGDILKIDDAVVSGTAILQQYYLSPGVSLPETMTVELIFARAKAITSFFTAWKITTVETKMEASAEYADAGITYDPADKTEPSLVSLQKPMQALMLKITLTSVGASQYSPFFEVRGCVFDTTVQSRAKRAAGAGEVLLNGYVMKWDENNKMTTIAQADGFCAGGSVSLNSQEKIVSVFGAIDPQLTKDVVVGTYNKLIRECGLADFLMIWLSLGLRRVNDRWVFDDGTELSNFANWDEE